MVEGQAISMKIGDLAARAGMTPSRIRYYETAGLISPARRTDAGYRLYDEQAVQRLEIIGYAQLAGFTLAEMRSLLPLTQPGKWDREALVGTLRTKAAAIEQLQQRLAAARDRLESVIADVENTPEDLECDANARRVLDNLRGSSAHGHHDAAATTSGPDGSTSSR
ncbi:MerR family transcriptional regulator [Nocardia sp. BSTN01]|uniref:MerR family transcriptional regulator n=1 Tax=Nocardia sp. BSTN01 TaxID=2783665 RepID=UPI001E34C380|nr:MerR family transcriptional regulator [Nocardia sp. BSTN01]